MDLLRRVVSLQVVSILAGLILAPDPGRADWPSDSSVNLPLSTTPVRQISPAAIPDGTGGTILTWTDYPGHFGGGPKDSSDSAAVFVQRVTSNGVPLWGENGLLLCNAPGEQSFSVLVADGAGGAIIAWRDDRGGNLDVYAARVGPGGDSLWPACGVALCTNVYAQGNIAIASDGAGGAIVTWEDCRSPGDFTSDIYAQRVSAAGQVLWAPDGVALCTAANGQIQPRIAADGTGGAIIAWPDSRRHGLGDFDVYAMRVDAFGDRLWQENGIPVCPSTLFQSQPRLLSDGLGGAIIAWSDQRADTTSEYSGDVYAQSFDAQGTARWAPNGVPLCVAPWPQYVSGISPDGDGGAIVVWEDFRSESGDIYAQRVSGGGQALWAADGIGLCVQEAPQVESTVVADGFGGAIVGWVDWRSSVLGPGSDIYAQRVSGAGVPLWFADGAAVATAGFSQVALALAPDGLGGAVFAWEDGRAGTSMDIYAQRVFANGQLGGYVSGVPESVAYSLQVHPNPFNPRTTITFDVPAAGPVRLSVFDLAGRLVRTLIDGSMPEGSHEVVWDGWDASAREVGSGSYLARLEFAGKVETVRMGLVQ
jgi:hypothetical protein